MSNTCTTCLLTKSHNIYNKFKNHQCHQNMEFPDYCKDGAIRIYS